MTQRRPASPPAVPAYFDGLLQAHAHGAWGRWVHLGLWDTAPSAQELARPGAYDKAMAYLDDRLRALADLCDGQCVLDVGCGLGGTIQAINARHHGMQLVGINIDPRQLAACSRLQARQGNGLLWLQADATALPWLSAAADRVLCVEAMFHFASRRAFLLEAARVLAPGGVLVASDIVITGATPDEAQAIVGGFGPWPDLANAAAFDLTDLASEAGLRVDSCIDATAATLPSHHFTGSGGSIDCSKDPVARACHALRKLHERGALRYLLLRCTRAPIAREGPPQNTDGFNRASPYGA